MVQHYPKAQEAVTVPRRKVGDAHIVGVCYVEHAACSIAIDDRGNIAFSDKRNTLVDDNIFNIKPIANENRASGAHVVYGSLNRIEICWSIIVHSHGDWQGGCLHGLDSAWDQERCRQQTQNCGEYQNNLVHLNHQSLVPHIQSQTMTFGTSESLSGKQFSQYQGASRGN